MTFDVKPKCWIGILIHPKMVEKSCVMNRSQQEVRGATEFARGSSFKVSAGQVRRCKCEYPLSTPDATHIEHRSYRDGALNQICLESTVLQSAYLLIVTSDHLPAVVALLDKRENI
jgi:hypothetical protein